MRGEPNNLTDYFSITIPRYLKDVYFNSFFPSSECLPLTYDPNDMMSKVDRHILSLDSFLSTVLFFPSLF